MPNRAQRRAQKFAAVQKTSAMAASPALAMAASASHGFAPAPAVMPEIPQPTVTFIEEDNDATTRKINVSDAKIAANRANAQLSCGPRTTEGKAKASLNAVKTGLTGRTVLLPGDDAALYQAHIERHFTEFAPETESERVLVQLIADTEWRLLRISPLEAAIWSHGAYKLSHLFAEVQDEATRENYIQIEILQQYRKDFANLALQESRLNRQKEKHVAELKRVQSIRRADEKAQLTRAAGLLRTAIQQGKTVDLPDFGFDFSTKEFYHFIDSTQFEFDAVGTRPPMRKVVAAYRAASKTA